jgi:uroporphyrinogen decarboxylase
VDYFGIDGRMIYGGLQFIPEKNEVQAKTSIIEKADDKLVTRTVYSTPAGDLDETTVYQIDNPPTVTGKLIKDLKRDLPAYKYFFPKITGVKKALADQMRREAGEKSVFCLGTGYPGFHYFTDIFEGGLEDATYAYMDYPDLFEDLRQTIHNDLVRKAELILDYAPDIYYMSASGTLTLSMPDWVRQFSLPTVKTITKMAKEAGVPSMIHACGKARLLVEMYANETDLTCMNPLEPPPMGDCDLKEVKEKFGQKVSLAGNIHTTDVMLMGNPQKVDEACRKAIEDAGKDGGFVLMTGDQCGRDTPEENLFAFVEAAKRYGQY